MNTAPAASASAIAPLALWILPVVTWIPDKEIRRLEEALALAAAPCAAEWRPGEPMPTVSVASRAQDIPDAGVPMLLSPTIDQPGDLAWHTVLDGRPSSLVLCDQTQVSLSDVQTGASHEFNEMLGDIFCDQYVTLSNGGQMPLENSDGTEGDTIPFDLGDGGDPLAMSNWVKRAWFYGVAGDGQSYDQKGVCTAPRVIRPNGYAMIIGADGTVHQDGVGPAAYKRSVAFRHGRRLAQAHTMAMRIRARLAGLAA